MPAQRAEAEEEDTTQVTKLIDVLKECVAETEERLQKVGDAAERVSKEISKPGSAPHMKRVLSNTPLPRKKD